MKNTESDCYCNEESAVNIANTESNAFNRANDNVETTCLKCARCRKHDYKCYVVSIACISCVVLFVCVLVVRYQTYMCTTNFDLFDAKLRNLQYQLTLLQRQNRKEQRRRSIYKFMVSSQYAQY